MYQYGGLENEPPTPVKMYSPFSIESPSVCPNEPSDLFESSFTSDSIQTPRIQKGGKKMIKKSGKIKPGL